ncbi:MAG: metal ABC transporter substrate-binding protein [Lentisphaerales bacterium]|nr:metal ABC transporter substrate-binding protein [Lentisphaerales bacterium]
MIKLIIVFTVFLQFFVAAEKLKVCATVTDLASITEEIGGDLVEITTFAPAQGNPHNVIAKPSFIRQLSQADLFMQTGFELEAGWVPVLLKGCRNAQVQPGEKGHLDPSNIISPIFEKEGIITRADGHIHPLGNPHYLMDPVNGLIVAHLIASRLKVLLPEKVTIINDRLEVFQGKLISKLIGEKLAAKYPMSKLSTLVRRGKLEQFLELTKQEKDLGGWLHSVKKHNNKRFIADHANYLYLAKRFDMDVVEYLEPKPGMAPTTQHLMKLVKNISELNPKALLTNSYFPVKYAKIVASRTKLPIAKLAHQVGARKEAATYLEMIDYNVREISKVLND